MGKNLLNPTLLGSTAVVLTVMSITPAAGQDAPGGTTFTFGLSSSLRVNDNYGLDTKSPGTTTLWDNRLSFGVLSETPLDSFAFGIDGVLRIANVPTRSSDVSFDDPSATLRYTREGANARLETELQASRVDLDFADPLRLVVDEINPGDLIIDTGTRETYSARLFFETGLNDPLGYGFDLSRDSVRYSNTTDPDLNDRDITDLQAFVRVRLSPLATGRLTYDEREVDTDDADQTDRTDRSLSFGVDYEINPITTLNALVGYRDIKETKLLTPKTSEDGVFASFGLTRAMVNGTAGVDIETDLSITGRRDTLMARRALDLPSGELSVSLGATRSPNGNTDPVGSLAYVHQLPTGRITSSFERRFRTNNDGEDTRTTRAALGYLQEINSLSSLAFDLDYIQVRDAGSGTVDKIDTASFRATYRYELTQDWNLAGGYEYRIRDETAGTARSNEVFLTLDRRFSIRR